MPISVSFSSLNGSLLVGDSSKAFVNPVPAPPLLSVEDPLHSRARLHSIEPGGWPTGEMVTTVGGEMLPLPLPELVLTSDKASPMPPKAAATVVVVLGHAVVGVEVVGISIPV